MSERRFTRSDSARRSAKSSRPTWVVIAGFLILVVVGALQLLGESADDAGSLPTPRPTTQTRAGIVGLFVQPEAGRAPILEEIDAARASITLEIYLLSDEEIIAALERAAARGVRVRVILEEQPFGGARNQPVVFERLGRAGIEVRWDNPAFRFTHIKTFVVDGRTALVMNQNLTRTSFTGNREFGVITTRPADVAQAAAIFESDWRRGAEPEPGPLIVSPTTSRPELLALIDGATRTLDLYAEVVRDPEIMDALAAAERRRVAVRLVMSGDLDGTDDNAEERAELTAAGVEVRLARGGLYIHAKMILADGRRAYVGSQNFTATSLDQNRELGMILTDPNSLGLLARTFANDFAAGRAEASR